MKELIIFCISAIVLVSCHNYKKDVEQLTIVRDSLTHEAEFKDSAIVSFLNDFNEIVVTLDSIKMIEKIVTAKSSQRPEVSSQQKNIILEDIALLNKLIQKNKNQIAALQKKLKNANFKVGQLSSMLTELEKMVNSIERQVKEKDTEILALNEKVKKLYMNINTLNRKITVVETESMQKSNKIELQTLKLNKANYAIGNAKELKNVGLIESSGGVLGVGRISTIKDDFNQEIFIEIDIREFNYIPLMVKKAEVVSVHPEGSFHISGIKTADTLFIDNKSDFWKATKYLVILTK
jgi:predicted RNase H-like nuclease (RuvC/YqgF family)